MNRFSVGYKIDKANRKNNHDTTVKINLNQEIKFSAEALSEEIVQSLLYFGFIIPQIMEAFKIYKFTSVDEAIYILMRDPETGKFNHRYVHPDKKIDLNGQGFEMINAHRCLLCNEGVADHVDYMLDSINEEVKLEIENYKSKITNEENLDSIIEEKIQNLGKFSDSNNILKSPRIIESKFEVPQEQIELFENPDICRICFDDIMEEGNTAKFECGHSFCKNCVRSHLNINITNGKVKCNLL